MAKKKEFDTPAPVYSTLIGNADPRLYEHEPPKAEDVQKAQEALQTQGRRGYKLQRINMGFTPANLDYIRVMSKAKGLLTSLRGSGWYVSENTEAAREETDRLLHEKARLFFEDMRGLGFTDEQIKDYVKEWNE